MDKGKDKLDIYIYIYLERDTFVVRKWGQTKDYRDSWRGNALKALAFRKGTPCA